MGKIELKHGTVNKTWTLTLIDLLSDLKGVFWPAFTSLTLKNIVAVVQLLSPVWLFVTPWTTACQAPLSSSISLSLLRFVSIDWVMPSNHLLFCRPLPLLSSIFPSIRVFSNESALCIRWPNYWSFSFSLSLSNAYSRLISFRMDGLDLAVPGTLKSLLQHHSLKASILQHSDRKSVV